MMFPMRPLLTCLALLLLTACSSAPVTPQAPPRIPDQVSNAVWEQDMQRFAAEDAVAMPPPGSVLFVGCAVAGLRIEQVARPLLPFLAALVVALLMVSYIPALSLGLPRLFGLM